MFRTSTTDTRQITYTKVGEHRGRKRLWLEGLRLDTVGFSAGARYCVIYDVAARAITLEVDEAGDRLVSGRRRPHQTTQTPIIDLASADLTDILGEAGSVRAELSTRRIVFSLHPREQAKEERETRTREHVADGYLSEGTLCAGGGVATLGIARGIEVSGLTSRVDWIIDRERKYLEVADRNNPAVTTATLLYEASLEELKADEVSPVDILQMSLPCTGHSRSGKAKRGLTKAEDHPTDALAVVGALRLLDAIQPSVVVSENVPEAADSGSYALLRAYLDDAGYRVFERVLDEHEAATIERRKRWWMVAISEGLVGGFDVRTLPVQSKTYHCLGDLLEPIAVNDPQWRHHDYLDAKQARDAEAGKGFRRQLVDAQSESVGTIGKSYAKRRSTEPFLTRTDGKERLLTPREHARVKGIPESLVDGCCDTLAHEILGQSILFPHALALGEAIADALRRAAGTMAGMFATTYVPVDVMSVPVDVVHPQEELPVSAPQLSLW